MAQQRTEPLRRAAIASAARGLHLGTLGGAVAAGVGLQIAGAGSVIGAAVLGLGVLAYGALVGMDVLNPEFVRRSNQIKRAATEELEPQTLADPSLRQAYQGVLANFKRCDQLYESAGEELQRDLKSALDRCQQLVGDAGSIAKKGDAVASYLTGQSAAAIRAEIEQIERLAQRTSDARAKDNYGVAAASKQSQLQTHQQLEGLYDGVHAQLRVIAAALDELAAKIVKLRATDVAEAVTVHQSITSHLESVGTEVEILDRSVEEALREFTA